MIAYEGQAQCNGVYGISVMLGSPIECSSNDNKFIMFKVEV